MGRSRGRRRAIRWKGSARRGAEAALRGANAKFERRFAHIESRLGEAGRAPTEATLDEMEALWREAKQRERKAP